MPLVTIIIPYYQRQPGILLGCVEAILSQRVESPLQINVIIVDDSSPLPASHELSSITLPPHVTIQIVRRENGGPGPARNTGLDLVHEDTDFVAFVDSDDRWHEAHLAEALAALSCGYDLYFCDHRDLSSPKSYLEKLRDDVGSPIILDCGIPDLFVSRDGVPIVKKVDGVDAFSFGEGEAMMVFLKYFLAHISTVVFRRKPLDSIRFNPALDVAAEDYLFVLELANNTNLVCFSKQVNVFRGRGVSIYMSAVSWDSGRNLPVVLDNLRCFVIASELQGISEGARLLAKKRIALGRAQFIYLWARRLILFRHAHVSVFMKALRADPGLLLHLPETIWRAARTFSTGTDLLGARQLADL